MLAKNKQDMDGELERNVEFLSDASSNREMNQNCFKLNTCDDEADINSDNNELEGGYVTGYFTIQISFFCLFKKSISPQPKRISKTACRKWSVRLNLKYTWIGTSSFSFSAKKSRKRWRNSARVIIMQEIHTLIIKLYVFSNRSKYSHNRLAQSRSYNEGVITMFCMFGGVSKKCWFLW